MERTPIRRLRGEDTRDGAGVALRRVFGHSDVEALDPFLMMDFFSSKNPDDYRAGFPMHPHRGIQTITYLLHGEIEHEDSLGHRDTIRDGECQWMNAGSGILHQEMPKPVPEMLGVQIWLNLPAGRKMSSPGYRELKEAELPVVESGLQKVSLLAGSHDGKAGPLIDKDSQPLFYHVASRGEGESVFSLPLEANVFVFCLRGKVRLGEETAPAGEGFLTSRGETLRLGFGEEPSDVIVLGGRPLKEPVAWGGPIVMNTTAELQEAFSELRSNTFLKERP